MTPDQTVLVTGASGFLGFQIVHQLLQAGYRVRGSARGPKLQYLKDALSHIPAFSAVEISDIATADLSEAFSGVHAVIHTAAPLPGRSSDPATAVDRAVQSSLRILQQAEQEGIRRVVITSSIIAYIPGGPYGYDDWNTVTKEAALSGHPWLVYMAEKKYADQAMLEYVKSHEQLDLTIIYPPWIFGPLAPNSTKLIPKPDLGSISNDTYIYALLNPANTVYADPAVMDVRDVAKAHVAALKPHVTSADSAGTRKRIPIRAPYFASYREAIQIIHDERPELRSRLPDPSRAPEDVETRDWDWSQTEAVLGMMESECKTWRETVLDSVDSLVEIEKVWKEKGFDVDSLDVTPWIAEF